MGSDPLCPMISAPDGVFANSRNISLTDHIVTHVDGSSGLNPSSMIAWRTSKFMRAWTHHEGARFHSVSSSTHCEPECAQNDNIKE